MAIPPFFGETARTHVSIHAITTRAGPCRKTPFPPNNSQYRYNILLQPVPSAHTESARQSRLVVFRVRSTERHSPILIVLYYIRIPRRKKDTPISCLQSACNSVGRIIRDGLERIAAARFRLSTFRRK